MAENDVVAPIMPTGSGVVDLEIAREQAALAGAAVVPPEQAPTDDSTTGSQLESEAHPS